MRGTPGTNVSDIVHSRKVGHYCEYAHYASWRPCAIPSRRPLPDSHLNELFIKGVRWISLFRRGLVDDAGEYEILSCRLEQLQGTGSVECHLSEADYAMLNHGSKLCG